MQPKQPNEPLKLAREVLEIEAQGITALIERLDEFFVHAHDAILNCKGRVVVTGIGKSGHIGGKIASTLASTGTPAFFMHPAEASHGDLGMITRDDVVIALSNSGESSEIAAILPALKRRGVKIIAITGNPSSTLAIEADIHLNAGVEKEACPLNLAPTASTTAALALGDALAVAVLDSRGFKSEDFAMHHPGGALGRKLLVHVRDLMHAGEQLPSVLMNASLQDAILEISRKGLGMTAIVDEDGYLQGMYTDGDLRRTLEKHDNIRGLAVQSVMTRKPRTIGPDRLAAEAAQLMQSYKISGRLLVVDENNKLIGALHFDDLLRAGVV
ncbi:MAG: KpsF/GutQ family sugar-phosphate isomerase [Pseudomonadota bacterium]